MKLIIRNIKSLIVLILISLVIGMSFFVPDRTYTNYNYFCFIIFLFMTFLFFKIKEKKNYFDFDSIFIAMYAIVAFVFPIFLFSSKTPFAEFFNLKYNVNLVSKGMYISLLGISGYYAGSLLKKKRIIEQSKGGKISTFFLTFTSLILALLFCLLGGLQLYQSIYLKTTFEPTGPLFQVIVLLQAVILTAIATEAYNQKSVKGYTYNKVFLITCLAISFLFLYAGSRSIASFFLLPLAYWYIREYKPINFLKFVLLILFAIIFMFVIQQTRVGAQIKLSTGFDVVKDLTIVDRNTYIGIQMADNNGFTYGKTMLIGVIGVVPSLERFLTEFFGINIDNFGSAELFTSYTFHNNPNRFGLGTNIFIDIFLSFGYIGTFLLMFYLGFFISNAYAKSNASNYYYYIIYTVMIANSVYMVRASFTYPLKLLIWSLFIGLLNKSIIRRIGNFNLSK